MPAREKLSRTRADLPAIFGCGGLSARELLHGWFAGIAPGFVPHCTRSLAVWKTFLIASLQEIHRVLRPGGHAAVEVGEVRNGKILLKEHVLACGETAGLEPLKILIHSHPFTKKSHSWGVENNKDGTNTHRVVLFQKA